MGHRFSCEDPIFSDVKGAKEKGWTHYLSGMSACTQLCSPGLKLGSGKRFKCKMELSCKNMMALEGLFQLEGKSTHSCCSPPLFTPPPPDAVIVFSAGRDVRKHIWERRGTIQGGGIKTHHHKQADGRHRMSRSAGEVKLALLWLCLSDLFRFRPDAPSRAAVLIECLPLTAVGKEITSRASR